MFGFLKKTAQTDQKKKVTIAAETVIKLLADKATLSEDAVTYMALLIVQKFTSTEACLSSISMACAQKIKRGEISRDSVIMKHLTREVLYLLEDKEHSTDFRNAKTRDQQLMVFASLSQSEGVNAATQLLSHMPNKDLFTSDFIELT